MAMAILIHGSCRFSIPKHQMGNHKTKTPKENGEMREAAKSRKRVYQRRHQSQRCQLLDIGTFWLPRLVFHLTPFRKIEVSLTKKKKKNRSRKKIGFFSSVAHRPRCFFCHLLVVIAVALLTDEAWIVILVGGPPTRARVIEPKCTCTILVGQQGTTFRNPHVPYLTRVPVSSLLPMPGHNISLSACSSTCDS